MLGQYYILQLSDVHKATYWVRLSYHAPSSTGLVYNVRLITETPSKHGNILSIDWTRHCCWCCYRSVSKSVNVHVSVGRAIQCRVTWSMKISETNIQILLIDNAEGVIRNQRISILFKVALIGSSECQICWVLGKLSILLSKVVCRSQRCHVSRLRMTFRIE
jgi:hypothetical protein